MKSIAEDNFSKIASKTLKDQLVDRGAEEKYNEGDIYATIRVPEIVKGLSDKEIMKIQREKQQFFRQNLDKMVKRE